MEVRPFELLLTCEMGPDEEADILALEVIVAAVVMEWFGVATTSPVWKATAIHLLATWKVSCTVLPMVALPEAKSMSEVARRAAVITSSHQVKPLAGSHAALPRVSDSKIASPGAEAVT